MRLDELDVVDVVPGTQTQAERRTMHVIKVGEKERWFAKVVGVEPVLICGVKNEVVSCVEAG